MTSSFERQMILTARNSILCFHEYLRMVMFYVVAYWMKLIKLLSVGLFLDIVPDRSMHIVSVHRNSFVQGTSTPFRCSQKLQRASSYRQGI